MVRRKKYSFWQQLMAALLIIISIFFISFLFVTQWVKQVVTRQYTVAAIQSVDAVARNIDYTLRDVEVLSNAILTNRDLIQGIGERDAGRIRDDLNEAFISNSFVEGIYALTDSGYTYVGAELDGGVAVFPEAALAPTSGEILWFPTKEQSVRVLSSNITKQYFSMGRKIIDVNSLAELGYLNIQINEWLLQESYRTLMDDSSEILICSRQGEMVSDSARHLDSDRIQMLGITETLLYCEDNTSAEYDIDGVPYVAISAPCNGSAWKLIKVTPRDSLYRQVEDMQRYLLIGGAVFAACMALVAYLYSRRISEPITIMQNSMKEVEGGNMQVQVDISVHNELDDLGQSFNHMVRRLNTLMAEVVAAEKHKNEMELEILHAQINPHFLYNTLNTIRWMAKIKGEDGISTAIVALVKLLRISINLGKDMITVQEEIDYVKNYLTIQQLRFNQLFTIEYDIREEHRDLNIPKLLLQPIVENSLIYGTEEGSELHIRIATYEERDVLGFEESSVSGFEQKGPQDFGGKGAAEQVKNVKIVVEDNGPGIEKEVLQTILKSEKDINKFSKVGLNNVNHRIKMYYGEDYGLEIISPKESGTTIIITIPHHMAGG